MSKFLFIIIPFILVFNFKANATINCGMLTEKIEKEYKIPNKLLTSISLVESGIRKEGNFVSWPWTLNVSGKSKFFKSQNETLDFLKKNLKKNKNIDVGCMQISLKYHKQNFKSLNHILDPETNIRYAAEYLRSLYSRHKTWNEAISRYHSSVPKRKVKYLNKVKSYWSDLRQHKIKIPINIGSDVLSKRDSKIQYFKEEFKKQKLLDNI